MLRSFKMKDQAGFELTPVTHGECVPLGQEIVRLRRFGKIRYHVFDLVIDQPIEIATTAVLDATLRKVGCKPIGESWQMIPLREASEVLSTILWRDMAYDNPIMEKAQAEQLTTRFLALFPDRPRFFTNRDRRYKSWMPATDATFDMGVIALTTNRVGMLWCEDED